MNRGENQVNKGEIQVPGDSAECGGDMIQGQCSGPRVGLRLTRANKQFQVRLLMRFEDGRLLFRPALLASLGLIILDILLLLLILCKLW